MSYTFVNHCILKQTKKDRLQTKKNKKKKKMKCSAHIPKVQNLSEITKLNNDYRRVIETHENSLQLVVMSIPVSCTVPKEIHPKTLQFIRSEQGTGTVVLNGVRQHLMEDGFIIVPAGFEHEIINTGKIPLKIYTIYSNPLHSPDEVEHEPPSNACTTVTPECSELFF